MFDLKTASVVLAAMLCLAGCGKQEQEEAVRLGQLLEAQKAGYAKAGEIEKELVGAARAWCGGFTEKGAGRGADLERNASIAADLAKSVAVVNAQIGEVRQAVAGPALQTDFTRGVRSELIARLQARQRSLQEIRSLLDQSATQLEGYRRNKSFAGDTYPGEVNTLDALLQSYKAPPDAVEAALASLREKHPIGR